MGYCCLEIKKIKTMGNLKKCYDHNFREADSDFPHVDTDKTIENHDLIDHPPITYGDLLNKRFREVEINTGQPLKKRKNSVLAFELVLTFSHEEIENIDLEKWEQENLKWLKEKFGENNVLSAMVHMDETTPHIHAIVTPITKDNRLCAKDFTGGKAKMFQLQDEYGKSMKQFGLERGNKNSRATKRQLNKFYQLITYCYEQTLPQREKHESEDDYYERVQEFLTNRELINKHELLKVEKERDESRTHFWNFKRKYKKAIKLYDKIAQKMNYDENAMNDLFNLLLNMEENLPKEKLHYFFSLLQTQSETYKNVTIPNFINEHKTDRSEEKV